MAKSYYPIIFSLVLIALFFQNCSRVTEDKYYSSAQNAQEYFQITETIVIQVFYENEAEPYVGNTEQGRLLWNILEENLHAIFQYRSQLPVVVVPKSLDSMTEIPKQNRTQWTATDILNLNQTYHGSTPQVKEAKFSIYFLNGNYSDGATPQNHILGVHISGTPIIAIFKNVVKNSGSLWVPRYVEQSTLVHEIGHALGLVNNGIPITTAHQDVNHGAHTTNSDCVMYYQNEGASDMARFIVRYLNSSTTVMWGPQVLADVQSLSR